MGVGSDRTAAWSVADDCGYGAAGAAGEARVRRTTAASIARRALAGTRAALTVRGTSRIRRGIDEEAHPTSRVGGVQERMPRLSLRSLRAKLQIFSLVLVVVPGVLFALIALARARDALEHAVGQQLGEVAHEALEELTAALAGERNDVRTWAHQDVMRDVVIGDLDKRASRFLRSLTDGGAPYLGLLCIG